MATISSKVQPTHHKKWPWVALGIFVILGFFTFGLMGLIMVGVLADKSSTSDYASYAPLGVSSYASQKSVSADEFAYDLEEIPATAAGTIQEVTAESGTILAIDQKIIKTAELDTVVNSTTAAVELLTQMAETKGGFVLSSETYTLSDETLAGQVSVRVPTEQFETTLAEIKSKVVLIETETITGTDVTEEYIDLESRLKNAQALEINYLAILEKSGSVEDTLKVTKALGEVREEIEILQGRIRYLDARTNFSTITVYLRERPSVVPNVTDKFDILLVFQEAFQTLVLLGRGALVALIWLGVLGGPIFIFVWIVWRLARRGRRHARKQTKS